MARYRCSVCGHIYDESREGTRWRDLPDDWVCPACGAPKSAFEPCGDIGRQAASLFSPFFATIHRLLGYVFVAIYLVFMVQMVPRLFSYQIEFPARTVAHITLGMAIGAALLLKVLTVRFFPRFNETLVPALGASLFMSSVVLIGISTPFAFQQALMERASASEGLFTETNLQRLRGLLLQTGLDASESERLAQRRSLLAGRQVLRTECTECHDLRTVLARPRTPDNWLQTVRRMADRTTAFNPLEQEEQWQVTAYLIAISPQLQRSTQELRSVQEAGQQARQAAESALQAESAPGDYNAEQARALFTTKCSECHEPTLVEQKAPGSRQQAQALVARMVDEGLRASEDELNQIIEYLTRTYAASASK